MYQVHFQLPQGAAGLAAQHAAYKIKQDLALWREQSGIPYRIHTNKYDLVLELALDKDATWFALTWQGRPYTSIEQV